MRDDLDDMRPTEEPRRSRTRGGQPSLTQLTLRGEASLASSLRRVLPVDGGERVTVSAFNSCI